MTLWRRWFIHVVGQARETERGLRLRVASLEAQLEAERRTSEALAFAVDHAKRERDQARDEARRARKALEVRDAH